MNCLKLLAEHTDTWEENQKLMVQHHNYGANSCLHGHTHE